MDQLKNVKKFIQESENLKWRKHRFRIMTVAGIALLAMVIITSVTLALLGTNTSAEINGLGFGQAKVTIEEKLDGWEQKEVRLCAATGDGYVPGVARAMFVIYILNDDGNYIPGNLDEMSEPVGNEMILGDFTLELAEDWDTYWFYKDGYFYYRTVLYPTTEGDANKTSVLLKKVSFTDEGAINEYGGAKIKVDVLASILQAEGNAAQEWGVTVDGSTVSP